MVAIHSVRKTLIHSETVEIIKRSLKNVATTTITTLMALWPLVVLTKVEIIYMKRSPTSICRSLGKSKKHPRKGDWRQPALWEIVKENKTRTIRGFFKACIFSIFPRGINQIKRALFVGRCSLSKRFYSGSMYSLPASSGFIPRWQRRFEHRKYDNSRQNTCSWLAPQRYN